MDVTTYVLSTIEGGCVVFGIGGVIYRMPEWATVGFVAAIWVHGLLIMK